MTSNPRTELLSQNWISCRNKQNVLQSGLLHSGLRRHVHSDSVLVTFSGHFSVFLGWARFWPMSATLWPFLVILGHALAISAVFWPFRRFMSGIPPLYVGKMQEKTDVS